MSIEVRQLIVKSKIVSGANDKQEPQLTRAELVRLKKEIIAQCREMIADDQLESRER